MALLRNNMRILSQLVRNFSTKLPESSRNVEKVPHLYHRHPTNYGMKTANLVINQWLANDKEITPKDWVTVQEELLSSRMFTITNDTVDTVIVNLCTEMKKPETAMAYLEYVWDKGKGMNISAMTNYLQLCYDRKAAGLGERRKKYLLDIYDTIRKKYPLFDAFTGESCVCGISLTERWKEGIEIMDIIKLSCKPRYASYSAIVSAAFINDEPEIGWKYLFEALERLSIGHEVYIDYLEYCKRNFQGVELENAIRNIVRVWGEYDTRPCLEVINAYRKVMRDLNWSVNETSVRRTGVCKSCSHTLKDFTISKEEFSHLARLFYERVIIGDDVYQKSSPSELKEYVEFVEALKPWDIVIDGLNVSYTGINVMKAKGLLVTKLVKMCVKWKKKVLVLGREHMKRWPSLDLKYINENADIFFTDNRSADDPYLLYATLSSGPSTMFISKDLMRQHKFLLQDREMKNIFKNWQITHQLYPVAMTTPRKMVDITLKTPPEYLPIAQAEENCWHVPYTRDTTLKASLTYEPPTLWMCFKKK